MRDRRQPPERRWRSVVCGGLCILLVGGVERSRYVARRRRTVVRRQLMRLSRWEDTSRKSHSSSDSKVDEEDVILVGGNFSIGLERGVHLAQYGVSDHAWTKEFEPKLFVYGDSSGSGAEVYALLVNESEAGDEVFVAGQFDSISEQSQSQYCSLGRWVGMRHTPKEALERVGESGLCSRASDPATKIFAAELGEGGDLFVGGSFSSRIWDGSSFVSVRHLARFDARRTLWTPLRGSTTISSPVGEPAVLALAYARREHRLFVGGRFEVRDERKSGDDGAPTRAASSAIAEWSEVDGLRPFEGGSLWIGDGSVPARCVSLALDPDRGKLYVAGQFDRVGDQTTSLACRALGEYAVGMASNPWSSGVRTRTGWKCVQPPTFELDGNYPISLLFDGSTLYAAGRAADSSSWWQTANGNATAAIARYSRFVETTYTPVVPDNGSTDDNGGRPPPARDDDDGPGDDGSTVLDDDDDDDDDDDNLRESESEDESSSSRDNKHRRRLLLRRRGRRRRRLTSHAGNNNNNNNNNNSSSSSSDRRPAVEPTEVYYYAWEWLPGWRGLNGTIYALAAGAGPLAGCVLVGGEFTGEPPLVVWRRDAKLGPFVRGFAGRDPAQAVWQGKVTAIAMVSARRYGDAGDGASSGRQNSGDGSTSARSLAWILKSIATAILSAGCAGVLLLCWSRRRRLSLLAGDARPRKKSNGISLQMLSYGFAPDLDFEFSDAYERAMRARHLVNRHSLVMIDPSEITLHEVIGEGSFGRVWSATWQTSAVAVKEFVLAQAAFAGGSMHRRDIIEEIVGEAGIMAYLRHPKILQLYGCSLTAQAIWIVSELCAYGSLRQVLDDPAIPLPAELRLRMAIDVAEGMLYLHTRDSPIVHRDLKSHNLFVVDQNGAMKVRIGDWGSARAVAMSPNFSRTMTHGVGTTCWLAPELIKDAKGSERIDVYAFGIVLWELATREEVYAALSAAQIISKVANEGMRPPLPPGCPWNHVMKACWSENPAERPDFEEIFAQLSRIYEDITGEPVPSEGDGFVRLNNHRRQRHDYPPLPPPRITTPPLRPAPPVADDDASSKVGAAAGAPPNGADDPPPDDANGRRGRQPRASRAARSAFRSSSRSNSRARRRAADPQNTSDQDQSPSRPVFRPPSERDRLVTRTG
ncbi:hypothetical protein CTAYLR_000500 [Chrysophaeum taylorii]|uniref:Protein kinase domain-containing protein n=1 Tax=Chrysophaeum taylorii TaxID=2483200 RepID=A0AAD7UGY1_9STRA|nr:hypothetical protein CTAYLR_000500 [Chrysophaeum taylorii]